MTSTIFLILSLAAHAAPTPNSAEPAALTFSGEVLSKAPYRVQFTPPAGHHFNLGAPTHVDVANGASAIEAGSLEKDPQKVTVGFHKIAKIENQCTLNASLYVCNDANTYCRPVKQSLDCQTLAKK